MDSETKKNLVETLRDITNTYNNAEPEKRDALRKEIMDINSMLFNDDKFEEEKRKNLAGESLREQELGLKDKELDNNKDLRSIEIESNVALKTHELDSLDSQIKYDKKMKYIDTGIKIASVIFPAALYFTGMMFSLKLEYNDMGRTPGAFKDFLKKF